MYSQHRQSIKSQGDSVEPPRAGLSFGSFPCNPMASKVWYFESSEQLATVELEAAVGRFRSGEQHAVTHVPLYGLWAAYGGYTMRRTMLALAAAVAWVLACSDDQGLVGSQNAQDSEGGASSDSAFGGAAARDGEAGAGGASSDFASGGAAARDGEAGAGGEPSTTECPQAFESVCPCPPYDYQGPPVTTGSAPTATRSSGLGAATTMNAGIRWRDLVRTAYEGGRPVSRRQSAAEPCPTATY
jgi:hypothetical protein